MKTTLLISLVLINVGVLAANVYFLNRSQTSDQEIMNRIDELEETVRLESRGTLEKMSESFDQQSRKMMEGLRETSEKTYAALSQKKKDLNQELQKLGEKYRPQAEEAAENLRETGENLMKTVNEELQKWNEKMGPPEPTGEEAG